MLSRLTFIPLTFVIVAIKNIRNMHAVSTNQITDILYFNDNYCYLISFIIVFIIKPLL